MDLMDLMDLVIEEVGEARLALRIYMTNTA